MVWLFGPYLLSQLFAILALIRGRRMMLKVRQDFPTYVRRRRPTLRTALRLPRRRPVELL